MSEFTLVTFWRDRGYIQDRAANGIDRGDVAAVPGCACGMIAPLLLERKDRGPEVGYSRGIGQNWVPSELLIDS